ncbi:MAG: GNAT family N-acetyltransferase [Ignavibacteriota bacterium]|jgi:RimJ/RimL family protein N-acetyltransferase|nr:MAG: N-acetyltransferase [Chlorobiota bacterium]MBE7477610.1 GNAT family N-acetyltransferase [Ignavibacteriales bacterium]MBL1124298.1 N-acetyltransferase [Ignavibacteriota bacterium]MCC7092599.1 GNAT family N-acetyltransferase [Ignavibacteriaceae bacterium]MEB2297110.1 GNAT family protein [Ignavibacteria bacterium]
MKIYFGEYCIRSYEYSDQKALVKYANNYNVSRLLRDQFPFPYTSEMAEMWLVHACNQNPESNFVIANEKELIGAIGINLQDDVNRFSAEIGYWLGEPFWNKGIITQALNLFSDFAFNKFELNRIFANVFEGNDASEKVLRKTGYKKEATLKKAVFKEGKFIDQHIYALLKDEFLKSR